jgi:hypothetical protein
VLFEEFCVCEQLLRVLTPAGIELSLTAAGDIERERALLERVIVTMPGDAENVVVRIW